MSNALEPSYLSAFRSASGAYSLVLGTVLGTTVWHSLIGGPVAYKSLPRQSFGHLQSNLFPHFFRLQTGASVALIWLYSKAGNVSLRSAASWKGAKAKNLWVLAFLAGTAAVNQFVVGPWTTGVMKRRHRKERLEGKDYSDPTVSDEMKLLNKSFAKLHGVSSLLNLAFLGALIAETARFGAYGAPWSVAGVRV